MREADIRPLLKMLGLKPEPQGKRAGWVLSRCPLGPTRHSSGQSNSSTFGVKVNDKGLSRANCFACGFHGDLQDLLIDLRLDKLKDTCADWAGANKMVQAELEGAQITVADYDDLYGEKAEQDAPFPLPWLQSFALAAHVPAALKYLEGRGITEYVAKILLLRYDGQRRRVCFPIYNRDGVFVGLHGRDITGKSDLPYYAYRHPQSGKWNRLVWYGENWVDPEKTVVLVESVFDLAKVYRVYRNVMCGLSAGLSRQKVQRLSGYTDIVTICDHGTGGEQFLKSLVRYLPDSLIQSVHLTKEEKDPGNLGTGELIEKLGPYVALDNLV